MSEPTTRFSSLAGTPLHYARAPVATYGTRGRPRTFNCTPEFLLKLEACFDELFRVSPLGRAEIITTAGAFVERSGFHGRGRAFDLDALFWSGRPFITLRFPTDQKFYLGVEAVLRKHFGTVLNFLYNSDHHDHLHIDDGTAVGFVRSSKSRVLFVQAALTHVLDVPVRIDGVYDPETEGGLRTAFERLGLSGNVQNRDTWLEFLTRITREALS
jgi:hypothetical protein